MKQIAKNTFTIVILIVINFSSIVAQENVALGTDLVSRYVWRGLDFGDSPSIQPTLNYSNNGFEVGAWGAYQLGRDASSLPADELDLYLGYSTEFGNTTFSFVITDYYFPNAGVKFGNFSDNSGAHLIEIGGTLSQSNFYLSAFVNVYNDADNSSYFEIGYNTSLKNVNLSLFIGATPGGDGLYYGTNSFNVINIGISAAKEIKITENFSLPIFGSYIFNPNQEVAHFVFGISL